jgi:biotin carboxylase
MNYNSAILIFGGSELQFSIIRKCIANNLYTVVIDPNPSAKGQEIAHAFEVVGGNDFDRTCAIIEKYDIKSIITAATDKPLLMMARIAAKYGLLFFSEDTATISTDKYLMKLRFQQNGIPCATGYLVSDIEESFEYPLIVKPRDNSGSRGVVYCESKEDVKFAIREALLYTNKSTVLVEEVIEGCEYSIESLHFNGETKVIQFTEKITSSFPYNVELGHIQPAMLDIETKKSIIALIEKIALAFKYENCASHTELKINDRGIFIIETSPRLGGDFITASLTQLSTGIDIEQALIDIAIRKNPLIQSVKSESSGIFYLNLPEGEVKELKGIDEIKSIEGVIDLRLFIEPHFVIPRMTNSLDRYGFFIISTENRQKLIELSHKINDLLKNIIIIV